MRILVACEESGIVCQAFRKKGHEAYSCDIKPTSGNLPQYHIQDNVLNHLEEKWDMLIGFPPCTYFSRLNFFNYYRNGKFNEKRWEESKKFVEFFYKLWNANIKYICLENPVPFKLFNEILPKPTMYLQPYEYGHNYTKKTCLWLKNLPPLLPTHQKIEQPKPYVIINGNMENNKTIEEQSKYRSKTFTGVANAMAEQWNF